MTLAIIVATVIGLSGGAAVEDKYDIVDFNQQEVNAGKGQTNEYPSSKR